MSGEMDSKENKCVDNYTTSNGKREREKKRK